jgi:hypothetical protein
LYDAKLLAALSLVGKICALEPDLSTGYNLLHYPPPAEQIESREKVV